MVNAPMTAVGDDGAWMERRVAWFVALTFFVSNLYYFHRWAFRYSSSGTSPTYADTPFTWQVGKYVLLVAAAVAMWAWVVWNGRAAGPWWHVPYRSTGRFAAILAGVTVYAGVVVAVAVRGAPNVRELVSMVFFVPIVLLLPVGSMTSVSFRIYRNVGLALVGYHVVFTAVQVSFYLVADRLPALAYAGGLVRFGGGLDDPNGFGIMVVLPILLTVTLWADFGRRWWAFGLLAVLLGLLFLPLSFSAIAGCAAGLLALAPITRRPKVLIGVLAAAGATLLLGLTSSYIRGVVEAKSKSAWSRLDFDGTRRRPGISDFLGDLTVPRFLFGAPRDDVVTEIGYLSLFANFGVVGLVAVIVLMVIAFRRALATARGARESGQLTMARLFEALAAFIVAFGVASFGIPYFGVFPANMLFWLVAMVCALGPHVLDRQRSDAPPVHAVGR